MQEGILLINKPKGFTSFDVIAVLRGMTHVKRIGHSGTLDPNATGVLPCLLGSAARLCDKMPIGDKTYEAEVIFGTKTDTADITGKVIANDGKIPTQSEIENVMQQFIGEIEQIPPMYSAVKINGQPLYKLAHQGKEVERQPRKVTIYDITYKDNIFTVNCSSGTYIRTLFEDIAEKLGTYATIQSLKRTKANGFDISECVSWEDAQVLAKENRLLEKVIPSEMAFRNLPILNVSEWHAKMLSNGVQLKIEKFSSTKNGSYRIYYKENFLGIAKIDHSAENIYFRKF